MGKIYVFCGNEGHEKTEALKRLRASLFASDNAGMNYDVVLAEETPCDQITDVIATAPFLADKRLVVIRGVDEAPADIRKRIFAALARSPEYTDIVLDVKKPLNPLDTTGLKDKLTTRNFAKPTDAQLVQFITKEMHDKKKKISNEAAAYLKERVGRDALRLTNEIEKLAVFTADRDTVTIKDVESIVVGDIQESAFALLDAIGAKDPKKALIVCERLDIDRNSIAEMLGLLASHLRKIRRIGALKSSGLPQAAIKAQMGISDYAFRKLYDQTGVLTSRDIRKGLRAILDIDADLKTGKMGPREAMTLVLLGLCGRDNAG